MTEATFDEELIDVEADITMVVAQRSGKNLKGYRLAMHTDVVSELRSICRDTLSRLAARTSVPYAEDIAFDPESQYLLVPTDALVAHQVQSRRSRQRAETPSSPPVMVETDPAARRILDQASSLPDLDASELRKKTFLFYAAVVGDDPDRRVAFVDKWNPYKAGLSGKVATFFGDRLRRIEGPLLVFERAFDMVVTTTAMAVMDASAFEAIFRDIDLMAARIPVWSDATVLALPLDEGSAELIRTSCAKKSRVAKQARGLYERGALTKKFDIGSLRAEMEAQGLDADRIVTGEQLTLNESDVPLVLKLIDEKLYTGWHSETPWDVATRSRRRT